VEGATFDDRLAEIEAMGGDPFFLEDEEIEAKITEKETAASSEKMDFSAPPTETNERFVTDGQGPSPRKDETKSDDSDPEWEWDGTVDEDAHMGWD